VFAAAAGMYLSFHAGTAAGASIAGVLVLTYVAVAAVSGVGDRRLRPAAA